MSNNGNTIINNDSIGYNENDLEPKYSLLKYQIDELINGLLPIGYSIQDIKDEINRNVERRRETLLNEYLDTIDDEEEKRIFKEIVSSNDVNKETTLKDHNQIINDLFKGLGISKK